MKALGRFIQIVGTTLEEKSTKRHAVISVYQDIAFIRNNFLGVFDNN